MFGPSKQTSAAADSQQNISGVAQANSGTELNAGQNLLNTGGQNLSSGTNYFNTILNGNRGNTNAMLQPDINRIRDASQNSIQAASTLMPRGGGRSSTLFNAPFNAASHIENLFNGARGTAATGLASIGQGQQGAGMNLFQIGNQPLSTASQTNQGLLQYGTQQQQLQNQLWSGLGSGLFNLGTTPFGGGGSLFSRI